MNNITKRIKAFNEPLLPDMVQIKYKAMSENPFRFFRGTCHIFYEDLSQVKDFPASPHTWICGDLHLENFGSFKGNNRMEYFDLNDFDEAMLAPLNWEVVRALTSIFVAFDVLKIKAADADQLAGSFLKTYSHTLQGGKAYYIDPRIATGITRSFLKAVKKRKEKDLLGKIIVSNNGQVSIKINTINHFKLDGDLRKAVMKRVAEWVSKVDEWPNNYKVMDAAFRVAGTGSIGLKRYMLLLQNKSDNEKYILVEVKQATHSSLAPYNKVPQPVWDSEALRLITIKKRMQNISPALTSTIDFKGDTFVFQEMQPTADKISFETIANSKKELRTVLRDMAVLTASAQIRSGGIQGSAITDALVAYGQNTEWQQAVLSYAKTYAKNVKEDYSAYSADYSKGLL